MNHDSKGVLGLLSLPRPRLSPLRTVIPYTKQGVVVARKNYSAMVMEVPPLWRMLPLLLALEGQRLRAVYGLFRS